MNERKIHFIADVPINNAIVKAKLDYFIDSINLIGITLGYPNSPTNINTKLLCSLLLKLSNSFTNKKKKYIKHYYLSFKDGLLRPTDIVIKDHYSALFKELETEFDNFINKNMAIASLIVCLEKVNAELESSYYNTINKVLVETFEDGTNLDNAEMRRKIEFCATFITTEFLSVGYNIRDVMQTIRAVLGNDALDGETNIIELFRIPIPEEIHSRRNEENYKELLQSHFRSRTIKSRLESLKGVYDQSLTPNKFIFKIDNVQFLNANEYSFNEITFCNSVRAKYESEYTLELVKEFLKDSPRHVFAEVNVISGAPKDAYNIALIKLKDSLDYLNYQILSYVDPTLNHFKAEVNLERYLVSNKWSDLTFGNRNPIRIKTTLINDLQEINELEALSSNPIIRTFLNIDKIYFQAFSIYKPAEIASLFWNYCEAFFIDYKDAPEIISRIVKGMAKRTNDHIWGTGVFRGFEIIHYYRQIGAFSEFGMTKEELHVFQSSVAFDEEWALKFNLLVNHPLVNNVVNTVKAYTEQEINTQLENHYKLILKDANYQRNLYQHSNVRISEIENLYSEALANFIIVFRHVIIGEIKACPSMENFESIFPKI